MQKIIITFLSLIILFLPLTLSAQVLEEHQRVFERVSQTVEKRFSPQDQERFYTRLATMIDTLLTRNTQTLTQVKRLQDMQALAREKLFTMRIASDSSPNAQRVKELTLRNSGANISGLTPYTELQRDFRYFITDERQFQQVGDTWHGVYFKNFSFFPSEYGVSRSDIERNNILPSITPLYRNTEGRYHFAPSSEIKILLREDVFFGLPEKFHLMQNLHDDMRYTSTNSEQTLREIQRETERITAGKTRAQQIEEIYAYILEHLSYSEHFQITDMYIYSGLEAFKRGSAVCTGYVKLMAYMLAFAGIDDFEVIRGYVIDADDFPQIGHAWIRIGDRYYDPTFDDPLGNTQTLTRSEYKYFALPRDIMYTNRFEYGTLPENLRSASMTERKNLIRAELTKLYPKYQTRASEFRVFDEMAFRERYNLSQTLPLTLPRLTSALPYISVNAEDFRFTEGGATRQIQSLNFFTLTDQNLSSLLEQVRYDLSEYQLMRWNLPNGTHEWRLGFNIVVR